MLIIAGTLYLPQHISFLTSRAWFYYNGDESSKAMQGVVVGKAREGVVSHGGAGGGLGEL